MFSFAAKHKRLLLGLGAVGAGITAYKTMNKQHQHKLAYCDSRYIAKRPSYEKILRERWTKIPYCEEERKDDWVDSEEKDGCKVAKLTVPYSDFYVIKGCMTAKTSKSVKEIMRLLTDIAVNPSNRDLYKKIDPDNVYYKVLEEFEKKKKYLCFGRWTPNSWVVSDRSFVVIRDTKVEKNKAGYMYGGSVDPEEGDFYPEDKDTVRGHINHFYWQVKRIDKDTVHVTYCTNADPKGSIPIFVYNMVCTRQAFGCLRFVKHVIED